MGDRQTQEQEFSQRIKIGTLRTLEFVNTVTILSPGNAQVGSVHWDLFVSVQLGKGHEGT